jgi:hypothetical protein
LNDEKVELEKELQRKKEAAEKDLAEREKSTVEMERELAQLREKAAAFPKDLDGAVAKAVKEATERVQLEAKNRDELQRRQFEGERNVLTTRVESLEKIFEGPRRAKRQTLQAIGNGLSKKSRISRKRRLKVLHRPSRWPTSKNSWRNKAARRPRKRLSGHAVEAWRFYGLLLTQDPRRKEQPRDDAEASRFMTPPLARRTLLASSTTPC